MAHNPRYNSKGYYATANFTNVDNFPQYGYGAYSTKPFTYDATGIPFVQIRVVFTSPATAHYYNQPTKSYPNFTYDAAGNPFVEVEQPAYTPTESYPNFTHDAAGNPFVEVKQPAYTSPVYERRSRHRANRPPTRRKFRHHDECPSTFSSKKTSQATATPLATESGVRHKIPAGYSVKYWDRTESPILLLGSVFDANSLGKWIYDWTAYCHDPASPISDISGELWLLLIKVAGKVKSSEECLGRVRQRENKEMIESFLMSGEELMKEFQQLLNKCEDPMLRSERERGAGLGMNAGVEFVKYSFGGDGLLGSTEHCMASARLWNFEFDAKIACMSSVSELFPTIIMMHIAILLVEPN